VHDTSLQQNEAKDVTVIPCLILAANSLAQTFNPCINFFTFCVLYTPMQHTSCHTSSSWNIEFTTKSQFNKSHLFQNITDPS
jgi:hypothetical protein